MIDIVNGLRRIAEEGYRFAGDAADEIERLRASLEAAEADALEQARLNGMGSEREAALMAKLEAAEKERDALRADKATLQQMTYSLKDRLEAAEQMVQDYMRIDKEKAQLAQRLEAVEGELETERVRLVACNIAALGYFEGCIKEYTSASLDDVLNLHKQLEAAKKERDALRAKIERMEKRLRLILEEPENTLSNSKALREVIRQAKLALKESK